MIDNKSNDNKLNNITPDYQAAGEALEDAGLNTDNPEKLSDSLSEAGDALGGKVGDDLNILADDWQEGEVSSDELEDIANDFQAGGKKDVAKDFREVDYDYDDGKDIGDDLEEAGGDLEEYKNNND